MASSEYGTFGEVKSRLDEILDAVSDETLPLDDALALYEEAVSLGLRASDLLEENIEAHEAEQAETGSDAEPMTTAQGEGAVAEGAHAAPAQGQGAAGSDGAAVASDSHAAAAGTEE